MGNEPVDIAADNLMVQSWAVPVHQFFEWLDEYFDMSLVDLPDLPAKCWVKICINNDLGTDGRNYGVVRYRRMSPKEIRAFRASPAFGEVTVESLTVVKMQGPHWFGFYGEVDAEWFHIEADHKKAGFLTGRTITSCDQP